MTESSSSKNKKAFITGITGQDGSYLAELLLQKGYEVHGLVRRTSSIRRERIDHLTEDHSPGAGRIYLHYGDLSDGSTMRTMLGNIQPDEVYNLAAQSHVRVSFDVPEYTTDITALGVVRLLESIRELGLRPRFYQASSSEMFGGAQAVALNENATFNPRSPYAAAKVYAHQVTVNYREAYGFYAVAGILFNHESPRRGETFVTRKITRALGRIKHGLLHKISLGNLEAKRDWGFAGDYVEAMWMMLQADRPEDYVIATGETHSVREFLELAAEHAGVDLKDRVEIDPRFFRPTEVHELIGDASQARQKLGWKPRVSFEQLVKMMVESDLERAAREKRDQR